MPLTTAQRNMTTQFMTITGANDRTAQRYLKSANWKLEQAMNLYYEQHPNHERPGASSKTALTSLFDSLATQPGETKTLGLDSTMAYISQLGFDLEGIEVLILFEIIQVPTIGEITQSGFVEGWSKLGATGGNVPTDLASQSQYVRSLLPTLAQDRDLFRRVYRHTFLIGREENQRALSLENAKMYWDLLFGTTGFPWRTPNKKWLEIWKQFLDEKWTRTVSRDMWNQTLEFAYKSVEEESLDFWSEDGAWPGVIDEFVVWCKEKGFAGSNQMEVDA